MTDTTICSISRVINFILIDMMHAIEALRLQVNESAASHYGTCAGLYCIIYFKPSNLQVDGYTVSSEHLVTKKCRRSAVDAPSSRRIDFNTPSFYVMCPLGMVKRPEFLNGLIKFCMFFCDKYAVKVSLILLNMMSKFFLDF